MLTAQPMPTLNSQHFATLAYERGFDIVELSGWMRIENIAGDAWIFIYGDPETPAWEQRYTALLARRVLEIDVEVVRPL